MFDHRRWQTVIAEPWEEWLLKPAPTLLALSETFRPEP